VEGSVVRSGERVRINDQLFQAVPERQLLSESYESMRGHRCRTGTVARDVAGRALVKLTRKSRRGW